MEKHNASVLKKAIVSGDVEATLREFEFHANRGEWKAIVHAVNSGLWDCKYLPAGDKKHRKALFTALSGPILSAVQSGVTEAMPALSALLRWAIVEGWDVETNQIADLLVSTEEWTAVKYSVISVIEKPTTEIDVVLNKRFWKDLLPLSRKLVVDALKPAADRIYHTYGDSQLLLYLLATVVVLESSAEKLRDIPLSGKEIADIAKLLLASNGSLAKQFYGLPPAIRRRIASDVSKTGIRRRNGYDVILPLFVFETVSGLSSAIVLAQVMIDDNMDRELSYGLTIVFDGIGNRPTVQHEAFNTLHEAIRFEMWRRLLPHAVAVASRTYGRRDKSMLDGLASMLSYVSRRNRSQVYWRDFLEIYPEVLWNWLPSAVHTGKVNTNPVFWLALTDSIENLDSYVLSDTEVAVILSAWAWDTRNEILDHPKFRSLLTDGVVAELQRLEKFIKGAPDILAQCGFGSRFVPAG